MNKAATILKKHSIQVHVPGHGSVTNNPDEIMKRLKESTYYINHLLQDGEKLETHCREQYSFFDGMKSIHFGNIELARNEDGESH